jgi:hypothetical protein
MSQTDPLLLAFVHASDAPCPACHAPLRDIQEDRCPACREELTLDVAMADPCTRHIALGALALGLGFGFCASFVGLIIASLAQQGLANTDRVLRLLPIFIGAPTLGAALLLWVLMRRRVRSLSTRSRHLAVAGCCLLTFAFVAWLAVNVIMEP